MLDRPRLTRISKQLSNIALARLEARLSLFGLLEAVAVSSICWICIKDSGADFGAPELYSLPLPRKAYILPTSDMQRTPGALSSPFAIVPCAYIHPPQWSGSIECAITMLPPAHSKPTSSPLSTICCCPQYVHPIKAEMMPLEIRAVRMREPFCAFLRSPLPPNPTAIAPTLTLYCGSLSTLAAARATPRRRSRWTRHVTHAAAWTARPQGAAWLSRRTLESKQRQRWPAACPVSHRRAASQPNTLQKPAATRTARLRPPRCRSVDSGNAGARLTSGAR